MTEKTKTIAEANNILNLFFDAIKQRKNISGFFTLQDSVRVSPHHIQSRGYN